MVSNSADLEICHSWKTAASLVAASNNIVHGAEPPSPASEFSFCSLSDSRVSCVARVVASTAVVVYSGLATDSESPHALRNLSPESVNTVLHKGASMLVAELSEGRVVVSALVTYENEPSSKLNVEYDSSSSLESVRRRPLIV